MLIDNLFELVVIGLALTHSRMARLPVMVAASILIFSVVQLVIDRGFDVEVTPGYEIYYGVGGLYFLITAIIFLLARDRHYTVISLVLFAQAIASGVMIINDAFWQWHEMINDKALFIECIIVWLSTMGRESPKGRK